MKKKPNISPFIKQADFYNTPGMLDLLMEIRELAPKRNWSKAQGISYHTNKSGLFSLQPKSHSFKARVKEILMCVGRAIGNTENIEMWSHYHTFLVAPKRPSSSTADNRFYQGEIQSPHKDFRDHDLKGHEGKLFICFIPLTVQGMQLAIYDGKFGKVYQFEYGKLYVIPADTVHAGGFCDDPHEGNLRLQLHITTDFKQHPLPVDGYQQRKLEDVEFELNPHPVSLK